MLTLKQQKTALKVGGGVVAAGVLVLGLSGAFHHAAHHTVPVETTSQTSSYVATTVPVQAESQEKQQKLSALESADIGRLANLGYHANDRRLPFGRECMANGTTDGTGYHGTSTGISYDVQKSNGAEGVICIAHSGKGGLHAGVGSFVPSK
jgi:hypothetical protein